MANKTYNTLTKKELTKLKKSLPKGFNDLVAEKLDLSISYINMVLAGRRKNDQIILLAIESAKKHKEYLDNISKQIQRL